VALCVRAPSKQLDPPEQHVLTLGIKKALRSNRFSEAQLYQRAFTDVQYKIQWDLDSNRALTRVRLKLQTPTHLHKACAELHTHYISSNINGGLCNLQFPAVVVFAKEKGREMPAVNS